MCDHRSPPVHAPADPGRVGTYSQLAAEEADRLDGALADIRAEQDAGHLTVREAADNRVAVLEAHLNQIKLLSAEYLGNGS